MAGMKREDDPLPADKTVSRMHDEGLVVHFFRHQYDAYVRPPKWSADGYDLLHKHEHEAHWRRGSLDETGLKAELDRLGHDLEPPKETPFGEVNDDGC